jgi:hypothetical protein
MYSSCLVYINIVDNTYFCNLCDAMSRRGIGSEALHAGIVTSASDNCEKVSVRLTLNTSIKFDGAEWKYSFFAPMATLSATS